MSTNKDCVTQIDLTGRVKWFNNKAGYGFITVTDGPRSGTDIFVHHSTIKVDNQQYKYLVQGEYVDFGISNTTSGEHEFQAVDVHGIKGGKLMCETRHEFKLARSAYKGSQEPEIPRMPRQQRAPREDETAGQVKFPRTRREGPREGDNKSRSFIDRNDKSK
jgi:CspA family cold shock protein